MTAQIPYRPQTPREESAWYGLWPEKRQELQDAWIQLWPAARATEARLRKAGIR